MAPFSPTLTPAMLPPICMSDMTHFCMYMLYVTWIHVCVTWRIFIRVTRLTHMCDMTRSYFRHDSFPTWLIYMCNMTHLQSYWLYCLCVSYDVWNFLYSFHIFFSGIHAFLIFFFFCILSFPATIHIIIKSNSNSLNDLVYDSLNTQNYVI